MLSSARVRRETTAPSSVTTCRGAVIDPRLLVQILLPILLVEGTAECPGRPRESALELDGDRITIVTVERVEDQQVLPVALGRDPLNVTVRAVGSQKVSHLTERRRALTDLYEAQVLRREPEFGCRIRAGEASLPSQAFKQFSEPAVVGFAWPDNQIHERRLLAEGGLYLPLVTIHARKNTTTD